MPTKAAIFGRARQEARQVLTEIEAKEVLKKAGLNVTETKLARSREEAVSLSRELGFPVVLKIASPDITHKSDVGGVRLRLETARQVGKAYDEILETAREKAPRARVQGVSVQKMARLGREVIIGMTKDPQFGPVLMFGLGGILVELLEDVSFRIIPITRRDAREMIQETKGYPLLEGYRGREGVDVAYLTELLLKVSRFVERNPQIKELDLNPVFAYPDGAVAVDAKLVLEGSAA